VIVAIFVGIAVLAIVHYSRQKLKKWYEEGKTL